MNEVKCIWKTEAELGEGVRYHPDDNTVWWVDILGQKIFRLDLSSQEKTEWHTPETVGCTFAGKNGDVLALFKKSIVRLNIETNEFETVIEFPNEPDSNRFNDGTVGPDGCMWVGSMDFDFKDPTGQIYRIDRDLKIATMDSDYIVVNGPAFNNSGDKMYVNETMLSEIYVYDVSLNSGLLTNKKLFAKFSKGEGLPDGICVDREGGLWVAVVTGGRVRRYNPDGSIDREIAIPSPTVTSVAIGGLDNKTLFVTTGRILMDAETLASYPLSGSLFAIKIEQNGSDNCIFG
jgi:D-xylonolactonase